MKSENIKILKIVASIIVLGILVAVGMKFFKNDIKLNDVESDEKGVLSQLIECDSFERLDISSVGVSFDEVNEAFEAVDENGETVGFVVYITAKGYNGPMMVKMATDKSGEMVKKVMIGENSEEYGKKVQDSDFLEQFNDTSIPYSIDGVVIKEYDGSENMLKDGIYRAEQTGFDTDFIDFVELEISDGVIVKVKWDGYNNKGKLKTELSELDEYKVEGSGENPWHIQAKKMESILKNAQDPSVIVTDSEGYAQGTDGVDINISSFIELTQECLNNAKNAYDKAPQTTQVEAVSGATVTSIGVVNAINIGTSFIAKYFGV